MPFGDLLDQTWKFLKSNKRLLWLFVPAIIFPNDFEFSGILEQYPNLVFGNLPPWWPLLPVLWFLGFALEYIPLISVVLVIRHYQKQEPTPELFALVREATGLLGKTAGLWVLESFAVSLILSAALSLSQFGFAPEPDVVKLWITFAGLIVYLPLDFILMFTAFAIVLEELPFAPALDRSWLIFRKFAGELIITELLAELLVFGVFILEYLFASVTIIVLGKIPIFGANIALEILVMTPLVLLIILTIIGGALFLLSMFIIYYVNLSASLSNSRTRSLVQSDMNPIS